MTHTYRDLLDHFGTVGRIAHFFGVSHQAVWIWQQQDKLPPLRRLQYVMHLQQCLGPEPDTSPTENPVAPSA